MPTTSKKPTKVKNDYTTPMIVILVATAAIAAILTTWLVSRQQEVVLETKRLSETTKTQLEFSNAPGANPGQRDADDRPLQLIPRSGCDIAANVEPPTQSIPLIAEQFGITLEVPFNPDWGSAEFRIAPIETAENEIRFGTYEPSPFEECDWKREYRLSARSPRTVAEVIEAAPDPEDADTPVAEQLQLQNVNAVRYFTDSVQRAMIIEIISPDRNLQLQTLCMSDLDCEANALKIADTMRWIVQ
ncbi:hypothetical protein GF380_00725 [Candidatus Uhrbacteria bacterium]|nr:hypothetical protein [Candidatus Uhrbacteria bacterium]MBD3283884.1 hypothetical protein [Candidatus Uhrbacteria bacterium]